MGNINFISFPSFSAVTRYEHSLGVCHLANLASKSLKLSEKDSAELMIAALYHDVTTPPFAHAMEEILSTYYGFNHEDHFFKLLTGISNDLGAGDFVQIFEGRMLKLPKLCQSAEARRMGIDLFRISELIFGKEGESLSNLISGDIDLDNIDNVIRSASAMGITGADKKLAETLARSFVFYKGESIGMNETAELHVNRWKEIRRDLYEMIFCSVDDFSLQAMLKHASRCLIEVDDEKIKLREDDWKLTEQEMVQKIKKNPDAEVIYKRMKLRDLYKCVSLIWLEGPGVSKYIENKENQFQLENICKDTLDVDVILNYYKDKRQRTLRRMYVYFDDEMRYPENCIVNDPGYLVGFFTPETGKKVINRRSKERFISNLRDDMPNYISMNDVNIDTTRKYPQIKLGRRII